MVDLITLAELTVMHTREEGSTFEEKHKRIASGLMPSLCYNGRVRDYAYTYEKKAFNIKQILVGFPSGLMRSRYYRIASTKEAQDTASVAQYQITPMGEGYVDGEGVRLGMQEGISDCWVIATELVLVREGGCGEGTRWIPWLSRSTRLMHVRYRTSFLP
ncbi:hypothetical protein BJ508DRAFT_310043 [Ascobolus immersus RN42]|uniref:Uncharacterized protein n=1 Tax=Ascobolus immersus RN42 TaxID=1160509 RepID=A0A3N4HWK9_ASCIM|nr:hypothetical protein BJ508DRAFT_310043 [Ascobolus immersus RN42]